MACTKLNFSSVHANVVNHVLNFLCKLCPELVLFLFVLHRVLPPRMLLSTTSLKKQIPSSQSIAAELYLRATSQL